MKCKKCGNEIFEDAKYCPYCGTKVEEELVIKKEEKSVTFKDGIVALFSKIFLFSGKSGRSEFNFGLLFLIIISSVLSAFTITPEVLSVLNGAGSSGMLESTTDYIIQASESKNILDPYNLYNLVVMLLYVIFLCAPVYRRLNDCGYGKKIVVLLTILFVVSEIVCSNLLWCILPENIYNIVYIFIEILSFINLFILLTCMLKKSKPEME